ncbi:hypothetical protein FRC03_012397 [Tulasnella sp. 419]|nr:hypothetical protein FRC03_012397 [Tulasnella sp. 419]
MVSLLPPSHVTGITPRLCASTNINQGSVFPPPTPSSSNYPTTTNSVARHHHVVYYRIEMVMSEGIREWLGTSVVDARIGILLRRNAEAQFQRYVEGNLLNGRMKVTPVRNNFLLEIVLKDGIFEENGATERTPIKWYPLAIEYFVSRKQKKVQRCKEFRQSEWFQQKKKLNKKEYKARKGRERAEQRAAESSGPSSAEAKPAYYGVDWEFQLPVTTEVEEMGGTAE